MSHTTKVDAKILDIDILIEAVENLKDRLGVSIEILENTKPRMYYQNQHGKCDYVLKLDGPYDVGLAKEADDSYSYVYDSWGGHIKKQIGYKGDTSKLTKEEKEKATIGLLDQEYKILMLERAAMDTDYTLISREEDENGRIHLVYSA